MRQLAQAPNNIWTALEEQLQETDLTLDYSALSQLFEAKEAGRKSASQSPHLSRKNTVPQARQQKPHPGRQQGTRGEVVGSRAVPGPAGKLT